MDIQPHILIIEDSTSQALRLKLLLKRAGYDVCVARDGTEGIHTACDACPVLILLDIHLPDIDGFGVLSQLKHSRTTDHIPVVMLTSQESVSDVETAIALGADGYLFKDDCLFRRDGAGQIIETIRQFVPATDWGAPRAQ